MSLPKGQAKREEGKDCSWLALHQNCREAWGTRSQVCRLLLLLIRSLGLCRFGGKQWAGCVLCLSSNSTGMLPDASGVTHTYLPEETLESLMSYMNYSKFRCFHSLLTGVHMYTRYVYRNIPKTLQGKWCHPILYMYKLRLREVK